MNPTSQTPARKVIIQLVDVLPGDTGWSYQALTSADADALENYISGLTGKGVNVQLTSVFANYETTFSGSIKMVGSNRVVTCTNYASADIDPTIPVIYTFGVTRDANGVRTIASCSGGIDVVGLRYLYDCC